MCSAFAPLERSSKQPLLFYVAMPACLLQDILSMHYFTLSVTASAASTPSVCMLVQKTLTLMWIMPHWPHRGVGK